MLVIAHPANIPVQWLSLMLQHKQWQMIVLKDPAEPTVLEAPQGDNYTAPGSIMTWRLFLFTYSLPGVLAQKLEIQTM